MIYFSSYFITKLRYNYATIVGWSIFVFHIICYFMIYSTPSETFLYGSVFFIGANLIGMVGSYNSELMNRKQFIYDKEIYKINAELKHQNDLKAAQLSQLEKSISENQQLLAINNEKDKLTTSLRESQEKYRLLATQMQLGLVLLETVVDEAHNTVDFKFLEINDSYSKLVGIKPDKCIGKTISEILPNLEKYWLDKLKQVVVTGKSIYYEDYQKTTNKYYSTYAYKTQKNQFAVLVNDITERRTLEEALRDSNEKFMQIFEKSPISIEFYDKDGILVNVNEACLELFGIADQIEVIGSDLFNNPNLSQQQKDQLKNFERIDMETEYDFEKVKKYSFYETSKSNKIIIFVSIIPLVNKNTLSGYLIHAKDITLEKQKQKEIEYISYHDYLTNLFNRRYFVDAYNDLILNKKFPLGVMMIDINGLKIINDAYGHIQGDLCIKLVSNLLMQVFGSDDVVARIGGDEFAVLLPSKNGLEIQDLKENIIRKLQGVNVGNIEISLAIGYEIIIDDEEGIDEILSSAENFLYRHKVTVGSSNRNHAIKAILNTLTDKYIEEKMHSERVSQFCREIGEALGVSSEDVDVLELAGMYHDIGKISIPDAILNKPGRLTKEEYEVIKTHTQIGYQILKAADEYSGLAEYALSHHERWDGNGYPKGLKGTEIPLYSRIISVADSFEAMTANRPYRDGMSQEEAILEIKNCMGSQFDPKVAKIFIEIMEKKQSKDSK